MEGLPTIRETVVDGVTTFWVDAPPPFAATLMFRVGMWDETARSRGITHLVEHLAFTPVLDQEYSHNGHVLGNHTLCWASGTASDAARFLRRLSESLGELPTGRLRTEAGILLAEAAGRTVGTFDHLLAILYGPNGPGLPQYPETGLMWLERADVQDWSARWFTQGNAVLLLTGPPPADLRLDLPSGTHRPYSLPGDDVGYRPVRTEILAPQERGICLGGLTPRSTEAVMALEIAARRLTLWLRHELGLVYSVQSSYLALDPDTAFFYLGVDAEEENAARVAIEFINVLRTLRDHGPSIDDMERARRAMPLPKDSDPGAVARSELYRIAIDRLLGYEHLSLERLLEERRDASATEVQNVFATVFNRAGIIGPQRSGLTIPDRVRRSADVVEGHRFKAKNKKPAKRELRELAIGPTGLSGRDEERWVTLLWRDLVLARRLDDGTWELLSRSGAWMSVQASGWKRGRWLAELLVAGIPEAVKVLLQGASDPADDEQGTVAEVKRDLRITGEFLRLMLPRRLR